MFNSLAKAFASDDGLRGVFSLIFTATILTVYELALFYYVVTPGISDQINNGIKKMAKILYTNFEMSDESGVLVKPIKKESVPDDYKKYFTDAQWSDLASEYEKAVFNNETKEQVIERLIHVLETLSEREQHYISKINNNTKFVGALLLIALCAILFTIYMVLKGRGESIGKCTWVNSILTVGLILAFNYSFYLYGNKYRYIGSKGNEEQMVYILNHLSV
jgi:predicted PurR-regulated permease PerM